MTRFWSVVIGIALISTPAEGHKGDIDYAGPDAGYVVYSVGTVRIGVDFEFSYRRTSYLDGRPAGDWTGKIEPRLGSSFTLKIKDPDFTGVETGHVVIRRLPPGEYEINDFSFGGGNPLGTSYQWSPGKTFSLPFQITIGQATYIGSFMRSPSLGTPLRAIVGAAGYFIVANRSSRDVPIANGRLPTNTKVTIRVTDVASLGNAALQSEVQ